MESGKDARALSQEVIDLLRARDDTIAVAESLTGGMLAASLTAIPGASAAFQGAVVPYATGLKTVLLGVPAALLDSHGAVHPDVARAMADGVAGPDPQDGQPVGTVYIAVSVGGDTGVRSLALAGGRQQIREATVEQLLGMLICRLREDNI